MNSLENISQTVLDLILTTVQPEKRTMIAIAGPPGSGKSTLAEAVVSQINQLSGSSLSASLLPMDGFHLDTHIIEPMGLLARRGAHETFDAPGFLQLMRRVRGRDDDVPYPVFDRASDRSIPDAGLLKQETEIVVVEGNYLLLNKPVWCELRALFDATVFLRYTLETLEQRLLNRWLSLGFTHEQAAKKVYGNDLKNAQLVLEHSAGADLTIDETVLQQIN